MEENTDYAEDPLYRSETYYGVVIHTEKYLGWKCTYAGDGRMKFQHDNGGKLSFYAGHDTGWMKRCWDEFLVAAQQQKEG